MYDDLVKALRERAEAYEEHNAMFGFRGGKCFAKHLLNDAADAIERLVAEVDRKDKALQAWANTWEKRKENAIRHICDHCDTPIEVRLKEGACEDCPIITLVKEIFDDE